MNWKIILILLVVCLGLGAYLYLEMGSDAPSTTERKQIEYLMSYPDRVESLTISFLDTFYVVNRRESEWVMAEPLAGELADSSMVNHLLEILARIPVIRSIPIDSVNLAQLYLDNPAIWFRVDFTGGDSSTVGFGLLNPTTENIYARREGEDRVLLIGKDVGPMLYINSLLLRSKQLISLSPYRVKHIRLKARQGWESVLDRDQLTGEWSVRQGRRKTRADKSRIQDLLSSLYQGQVHEYLPPDAANMVRTGLHRPVRQLVVVGEQEDSITVSVGNPQRGREYLRWAGTSICPDNLLLVDLRLVELLDGLRLERIRDLHVADFDRGGLNRIELVYSTGKIVLTAENDTLWRIVEPEQSPCKIWQVERLLIHADTMQASRVLPPGGKRGFNRPQLRMTLSAGSEVVARILVGDYKADSLYIRDDLRGIDFLDSSSELEKLTYTFEDLADIAVRHVVE